jgi:hypothetical protein
MNTKRAGAGTQVQEPLPRKLKVLSSNPCTTRKKKDKLLEHMCRHFPQAQENGEGATLQMWAALATKHSTYTSLIWFLTATLGPILQADQTDLRGDIPCTLR